MIAYQPRVIGRSQMQDALTISLPPVVVLAQARHRRRTWGWLVLLAPSLLALAVFTYWPVLRVILDSLTVARFGQAPGWGIANYTRLLSDPHFGRAVANNLAYAAGTILPSLILALLLALALQNSGRLATVLRTLVVLPLLIPLVGAAALFIFIFLPGAGLLDYYLAKLGIGATNWLGDPDLALGAIVAITIWKNTGYYMLFFLAGLAGVSRELLEAAAIDGAGAIRRFRHVTLPMLGPTVAFVLIIALLNVLTQVDHIIILTKGGPADSTSVVLFYIYQQAHQNNDIGLASAATVLSVGLLLGLSVMSLRRLEHGIHYAS